MVQAQFFNSLSRSLVVCLTLDSLAKRVKLYMYMPRITILLLGIPSITEIIELEEIMDFISFAAIW